MTGFDGGTNFGDSLSFPPTRRHGDVDRNPEIEKKLRPSCFSSVSCKRKGYACYFFGEVVSSVSFVSSEWTQVRRVQRHVRKTHSYIIIQKILKSKSIYLRSFWSCKFRSNLSEIINLSSLLGQAAMIDLLLSRVRLYGSRVGQTYLKREFSKL